MNPPANWYPDPTGRHGQRYWDGEAWTEHVFTDGVQAVDPLEDGGQDEEVEATSTGEAPRDVAAGSVEDAAGAARSGLFVDAGGAQTSAVGGGAQAAGDEHAEDAGDTDTTRWAPGDDLGTAPAPAATDEPAEHEADEGEHAEHELDQDEPDADEQAEEADIPAAEAAVAPEVEADDVVASLDEVAEPGDAPPPMGASDLSDAFVLAPETVSRLVRRQSPVQEEPADAPDPAPAAAGGAIDAPPPTVDAPPPVTDAPAAGLDAPPPTAHRPAGGPGGLGITGDLVGGAFAEREQAGPVALQNTRLLRCAVAAGTGVVARQGTMVAYQGDVTFERQGAGGVTRALKRAATGEGLAMMRVEGTGDVFFADGAQHVFLLELDGGPGISVNGRNVLAFSAALQWDIERVKGVTLLAGGLFNTTLSGTGWVALVSDGEPVVLRTDEAATYVDVNALVAWSAGLSTRIVNTVSAKSLVGLGSGEAFQMAFDGAGIVIVQPSEGTTGPPSSS